MSNRPLEVIVAITRDAHVPASELCPEISPELRALVVHCVGHCAQHLHVFWIGIVAREAVVELGVERDDLGTDAAQRFGRECGRGAVAARSHHLDGAGEFVVETAAGTFSD